LVDPKLEPSHLTIITSALAAAVGRRHHDGRALRASAAKLLEQ